MPCPASPEPDGFHRFVLPSTGTQLAAACCYCGAHRPARAAADRSPTGVWTDSVARMQASVAKGLGASHAARRRKREATP